MPPDSSVSPEGGWSPDPVAAALVEYGRRVVQAGLVIGASGNLSVRTGDRIVITPRGVPCDELVAADCPVVSLDGRLLRGDREPSSETPMHLAVYRATDAGAIVHTHSTTATALSTVLTELPALHYNVVDLGGALRVAPYATFGTDELATNVLRALRDRRAALMANHGTIAYGRDLAEALRRAQLVEWLCVVYLQARALGQPAALTERQLEAVRARGPLLRYLPGRTA